MDQAVDDLGDDAPAHRSKVFAVGGDLGFAQDVEPQRGAVVQVQRLQVGQVAQKYMGWAYKILPSDRLNMKQQLALGRPLIVGVRTHGLGNPNYPGYRDHYEQAAYSVSHYLVVVGYDQSDTYILNDPGLTRGKGYHITYDQLMHAIDDLDQAYPT